MKSSSRSTDTFVFGEGDDRYHCIEVNNATLTRVGCYANKLTILSLFTAGAILLIGMFGVILSLGPVNSDLDRFRRMAAFEFAASADLVSFPVILARDTAGLVIINRKTDEQKIFYTDRLIVHSPYISRDGERLLFVQRTADQEEQELVSCKTSNWHCEVLQKTKATIISPVELDSETILYSSSPLVSVDSGKRTTSPYHNLYRLKKGSAPVQLTTFDAFQLDPISVGGDRVLFSALRGHSDKQYIPARPPEASTSSDIFSAEISAPDYPIVLPNAPFEPLFLIGGYSTNASIAADGRHVAFLNRRRTSGETRFNLVIASGTGAVIRYIDARGFGFSRPVFVDETIMANELLQDHYEVRQFSASGQESESAIQIKLAVDSLKSLPRVRLSLTNTK